MPKGGFVKDYRSTLDWEWFTDVNTAHLWEYIRLRVNYEDSSYRGITVRRGEMLESIRKIAERTGMTVQNVRTSLSHLQSTGEVTCKPTRQGMLINAVNYAKFQGLDVEGNTPTNTQTNTQSNTPPLPIIRNKEIKNKRNNREAQPPTLSEIREYIEAEKLSVKPERFHDYYEARGWRNVKDWKKKIREWHLTERKDVMPEYITEPDKVQIPDEDVSPDDIEALMKEL